MQRLRGKMCVGRSIEVLFWGSFVSLTGVKWPELNQGFVEVFKEMMYGSNIQWLNPCKCMIQVIDYYQIVQGAWHTVCLWYRLIGTYRCGPVCYIILYTIWRVKYKGSPISWVRAYCKSHVKASFQFQDSITKSTSVTMFELFWSLGHFRTLSHTNKILKHLRLPWMQVCMSQPEKIRAMGVFFRVDQGINAKRPNCGSS